MIDPFWCKHCRSEFFITFDDGLTGDALIRCPTCGWRHPRQFVNGVAVSCDPPRGSYVAIWAAGTELGESAQNERTLSPDTTTTAHMRPVDETPEPAQNNGKPREL
jgi:hypothetical protein